MELSDLIVLNLEFAADPVPEPMVYIHNGVEFVHVPAEVHDGTTFIKPVAKIYSDGEWQDVVNPIE